MTDELTTGASANADNAAANEDNGSMGNDTQTSLNTQTQTTGDDWHTQLSEEYRNHPSIQKFSDVNGIAKSYLSLESLMGQEKVPVPKSADDTNAWNIVHKAFGVPDVERVTVSHRNGEGAAVGGRACHDDRQIVA